jgi:hypothetical protein
VPDCKAQAPIPRTRRDYRDAGLLVVGRRAYGYVAGGTQGPPAVELAHIEQVRKRFYNVLWPCRSVMRTRSITAGRTTPTIVLLDRSGIVRLFHPGPMTRAELEPQFARSSLQAAAKGPSELANVARV